MSSTSPTDVEVPLPSSKKQRSARSGGKKGWTPAVAEIRRLVGCSYSLNDEFSAHVLVWAKLDGGPWWPARVVSVDEIPEDLKKQEEGWICVKYYGVRSTQCFAWLKAEELSPYTKNFDEFTQQTLPDDFEAGDFKVAMTEIQEVAVSRNGPSSLKGSLATKHQESKILPASSSQNEEEDTGKDGSQGGDIIEQPLKRRKLKFKGAEGEQLTGENVNAESEDKAGLKDSKGLEKSVESKSKRKRLLNEQHSELNGDRASAGESLEVPHKKHGSSGSAGGLSSREVVKKVRGKKTGSDGYYFECMECDMGGDLLCCDLCPRVYHHDCLRPPLKSTPTGRWVCPMCRDTPGAVKAVGAQATDSKPKFKTTNENDSAADGDAPTQEPKPSPKRGWKLFQKGKVQGLELRKLRKRKREDDINRPRKKLNIKFTRPDSSQTQPKCRQCGAGIRSCGESPSKLFCKECVELVKIKGANSKGKAVMHNPDLIPLKHSKLKPGRCEACEKSGLVIHCDLCPKAYHKDCLTPPRKRAPKGSWTCPACEPPKEGMDEKEAGEEATDGKAVNDLKTSARVSKAHEENADKGEQLADVPTALEVDRIMGCRITASHSAGSAVVGTECQDLPIDGKGSGGSAEVLTEAGNRAPNSEEAKAIEIRLPICDAERKAGQGSASVRADEEKSAPSSNVETGVGSVDDVRRRFKCHGVPVREESLTADPSSETKPANLDSEVSSANNVAKKSGQSPREYARFPQGDDALNPESTQKRSLTPGKEAVVVESASKDQGSPVAPLSGTAEASVQSKSVHEVDVVNVHNGAPEGAFGEVNGGDVKSSTPVKVSEVKKDIPVADATRLSDAGGDVKDSAVSLLRPGQVAGAPAEVAMENPKAPEFAQPELEFLVKWTGRAHIHNEWVREEVLRGIAKRKLENYKLKHGRFPKIILEDQWTKPQRIIAKRALPGKDEEVFVKWSGLPYEDCTWESIHHPVIDANSELVSTFAKIEEEAACLDKELLEEGEDVLEPSCLREHRPPEIEPLREQPKYLRGGSLFPHQREALNWLRKCWHRHRNVILADEMGLGKTISACAFIAALHHEFKVKAPCLVLVPLSTMPNWLAEFALWAPSLNVIEYHGSAKARALIREYEWHAEHSHGAGKKTKQAFKFNVMLTTYEMVIADSSQLRAVPWEVLVVDEGHRLKNSSSKLFTLLNTFTFSHRVLLTGTPLQNNFGEMFNLLNFLQPDKFPSLAAFQDKFSSLSTAEQVDELKMLVAPNMLRRLKKDAMQKIPPKTELVVPVDLSSVQKEYYRALLTRNYQVLRNGGRHQSMLNIVMQLRKVCNHPYLIPGTEPDAGTPEFLQEMRIKASAKLMLLHSMLGKLREDGHRVLIFSQMTKLLDILEDYLGFEFGHEAFERVDGSVSVAERQTAITRFNQDKSRFVFLLSTRACGLGINLATADTVIIYDSDFNPQADIQAMNRAHRIGQSKTLLVYRLVVRASVEERILQLAKKKLMLDHLFANKSGSQKEVDDILRWGTEELFQEASVAADDPGSLSGTVDDGEAKQKKKGAELGDMYGDYYLYLGRSKVVWDEAAVKRLLDRSELSANNPDVNQGEPENDILGSLKAWDWNEQDVPDEQDGEDHLGKDTDADKAPKNPVREEENQWDKLLRSRWETMQTDEEAALGRGKRNRKAVSYTESNGQKAQELLSESSDAENDDEREPDYTPVGRALKQKLARLRARQKDRILQRYSVTAGPIDLDKMAVDPGMRAAGTSDGLKTGDFMPDLSSTSAMPALCVPPARELTDSLHLADHNGHAPGSSPSQGFVNVSMGIEHPIFRRSLSPSTIASNIEWNKTSRAANKLQFPRGTGGPTPIEESGDKEKYTSGDRGKSGWLGNVPPVLGSSSVMSQIFGKQMKLGDDSCVEAVPTISLLAVSQGLESGQSLSQLIPALRQSLQGVQYNNSSNLSATTDLPCPVTVVGDLHTNHLSSQRDPLVNVFSSLKSANGGKQSPNLEEMKSLSGRQSNKTKPPDVALAFSQKIFGGEKTQHTGDKLSTGEDVLGQQSRQGLVVPPTFLSTEENSSAKRSEYFTGVGTAMPSSTKSTRIPNLAIALGLQFPDGSPSVYPSAVQDVRNPVSASSSAPLGSGVTVKAMDLPGAGGVSHNYGLFHKLGTRDMMPIEINDDDPEPIVSTHHFLSPGRAEGANGRLWHTEDQRKWKDQDSKSWTEDELDALWAGVRRHGRGNWAEMLLDSRLCFSKSRSVGELAERWKLEQVKVFAPEKASDPGKHVPGSWSNAKGIPRMEIGTERGRASHKHVPLAPGGNVETAVVNPEEKYLPQPHFPEKKGSLPWPIPDFETSLAKSRLPFLTTSKTSGPPTIAGLQHVNKGTELGKLDANRQGLKYLLDVQSGRSSPSIPTSISGRVPSTSGAMLGTSVAPFVSSSGLPARLAESSVFRTSGSALDQVASELGTGLSPGLGLGPDWRTPDARERPNWQQQLPSISASDTGKHRSSLPERTNIFRSQDMYANVHIPPAPSPRMGSPPGQSATHKALVSLPSIAAFSSGEHRRKAKASAGAKGMSSGTADDSAPSSLPHWLREAVKARAAPQQPPLPPAIAAVVQATNMLYKDGKPLLPPLVHPGYPMVPPREFPKKVDRKRHRQKIGHQPPSSRADNNLMKPPNLPANLDFSHSIKVEGLTQPLLPLPRFDGGDPVSSRSFSALGHGSSALLVSKGFPELPVLSGVDHFKGQPAFHTPTDSLSELMATRRNILDLGMKTGLHSSKVSASTLDEPGAPLASSAKGRHVWPEIAPEPSKSWRATSESLLPALPPFSGPFPADRNTSRSNHGVALSDPAPAGRTADGSFSDPEKISQLPQWLLSGDAPAIGNERQLLKSDATDDDDESTSSKTVSDPGVRRNQDKDDESDDASSEETISDDGTQ